jgi:hypothetical protein
MVVFGGIYVTGLLKIAASVRLRRLVPGGWALGAPSALFGIALTIAPGVGAIAGARWIGAYANRFRRRYGRRRILDASVASRHGRSVWRKARTVGRPPSVGVPGRWTKDKTLLSRGRRYVARNDPKSISRASQTVRQDGSTALTGAIKKYSDIQSVNSPDTKPGHLP